MLLHQLFESWARQTPAAPALIWEGGSVSYQALDQRANRLAHHLRARGVATETLVGTGMTRSPEWVVAILAILKAGGAFVPLDPAYPADRLAFMRSDTGLALVIDDHFDWSAVDHQPVEPLPSAAGPDNLAYIIYTSGSTGRPKGIALPHRGVVSNLADLNGRFSVGPDDRLLAVSSLSFDMSVYEVLGTLGAGATLVIPTGAEARDPESIARLIARHRVTVWNSAPALLDALVTHETAAGDGRLGSLRLALLGGDWVPLSLPDRLRALAPGVRFIALGGATEASIHSTLFTVEFRDPAWRSIPYGQAMADQLTYVLDANDQPVARGEPGELHLGGIGLARGYYASPDLTAERFIPNPFRAGERMYRTGDLVRELPDGNLELIGRIDHQVKIRGVRVELAEVEAELERHAAVTRALATVRDGQLVAYVVPRRDAPELASELRRHLAARLPDAFIPRSIVRLPAFPLSPNGKIDRRALPAPDRARPATGVPYVAPRTALEQTLARLCGELFDSDEVGVDDNFFDLGAHSLLLVQLASRVRTTLAVEIALHELIHTPTVATLAQAVAQRQSTQKAAAPAIARVSRDAPVRASFAQQRLWYVEELCRAQGPFPYNEVLTLRLRGALDVERLQRGLSALIDRHHALRTRFPTTAGELVQAVGAPFEVALPRFEAVDLETLLRAEARRRFDLTHEPPLRASLVRTGTDEHVLVLTLHHLVTDGWSSAVVVHDLAALYQGALDELPLQYADYSEWQRAGLAGGVLEARLEYWRRKLSGAALTLALPSDRPRPATPSFEGARVPLALDAELSAAVRALARREGVTVYVTLLAAFQILLHRHSGQNDFLVGSVMAGRERAELEGLIGLFAHTVAMRADLSGAPSFRQLLERTHRSWLEASEHQDTPFEALVAALQPERDPSRNPLFQTLFVLQNTPPVRERFSDLQARFDLPDTGVAKFDLTLSLEERAGQLVGHFEYSTDLFDAITIERMAEHFLTLLRAIVAGPERSIARLPLLSGAELAELDVWSRGATPGIADDCLHTLFEQAVARSPDAPAARHGTEQLTFRQLDERANQLAHHLRGLGVGPEVRVAVCLERSLDLPVALLGVLKAGGAYVPLDPSAPQRRLALLLEDAAPAVLVTQRRLEASLPRFDGARVLLDAEAAALAKLDSHPPGEPRPTAGNLAYVIYTSGSTGRPKGVLIEHRGLVSYLRWCVDAYQVAAGAGAPVQSSPAVDLTVTSLFAPLVAGRPVVLCREDPGIDSFVESLRGSPGYSVVKLTPAHLDLLARNLGPTEVAGVTGAFVIGGEALPAESLAFFHRHAPRTRLYNEYGPTETVVGCAVYVVPPEAPPPGTVPIGRPIAHTELHVVDASLERVPIGAVGELLVGGVGVGRGYAGNPSLSAERFVPDPFSRRPGARLYRTGDRVRYRRDGVLEFLGRTDHQVKVRGYRVELGEIEAALLRQPDVREVVVVQEVGGERRLVAYVVAPSFIAAPATLGSSLRDELPSYMVPAAFVMLESLPRDRSGKINRGALPAVEAAALVPEGAVAPRNAVEQVIAGSWAELLGLPRIGVLDDFFELGGNSLLAIRAIARLRDYFHADFTLRELLHAPTVAGTAAKLLADPQRRARVQEAARVILELLKTP